MNNPLATIFANLYRWRHLPSYQLERRFDIFLTPYLHRIVEAHTGAALHPIIVPEMPLKHDATNLTDKLN
jgi:hypothetical protein